MILVDADACPVVCRVESKNHVKGPKKRLPEDDDRFEAAFEKLVLRSME